MKLARVTGTVEATAKDPALAGHKLLLCDVVDGAGAVLEAALVAVDTSGAGVGDMVLMTRGSAARMPAAAAGAPVDPVEAVGLDGDFLEAQAFAWLAVRVLRGLPTSGPTSTGARLPVCGGRISEGGTDTVLEAVRRGPK